MLPTTVRKPDFRQKTSQFPGTVPSFAGYMGLNEAELRAFGERCKELRGRRTQRVIADAVPVTERQYRAWENGRAEPQWAKLEALANVFGVTTNFLRYGSDTPPQNLGSQLDRIEDLLNRLAATLLEETVAGAEGEEPPDEGSTPERAPRPRRPR